MSELLLWPFVAGVVLTLIHAWFGMHVLARGVVFVDLSLAQMAALGLTVAILAGFPVQSEAAYWYALAFALSGALLFAATRRFEYSIQQEAVIGIVYAVSASLAVLALDRAPQGAEHVKQLLIGSILTVTPDEVGTVAALYAAIGLLHLMFRDALVELSFNPRRAELRRRRIFFWDFIFYGSFALVVTSSVRIAGVLLVFAYLIVPAALAGLVATNLRRRLVIAWVVGTTLTACGLYASWSWDLPTGPAIVTTFGAAAALVALIVGLRRATPRGSARTVSAALAVIGLLLIVFPARAPAVAGRARKRRARAAGGIPYEPRAENASRDARLSRSREGRARTPPRARAGCALGPQGDGSGEDRAHAPVHRRPQ